MEPLEILFLSYEDVEALELQDDEIIDAVADGLRSHGEGSVVMPPKDHLTLDDRYNGHFNILKGYVEAIDVAGVKVIGDYVDNYRVGLPSEIALLTLYDATNGRPLAIMDATLLTWMRTGAVSAIGARHLARANSSVLAHIGARGTARYNVQLLDKLFDFDEIRISSLRPESRERFAAEMAEKLGKPVGAVDSVHEAVDGADIVIDASRLSTPEVILETEWLKPGALVMPYGAVMSTDPRLPLVADRFIVDDWQQAAHSEWGQYYHLIANGSLSRMHVSAEIGQIVAGLAPGREREDELIVFWHRGFAVSDIMIGDLAYRQAIEAGIGTRLVHQANARAI
jgi:ornithine cyclodeaminase